jgi:transcriptional regulator with XRE-family HTH domain
MSQVEYRHVEGYESYRVGDDASVWSSKSGEWKRLKPTVRDDGYLMVSLCSGSGRPAQRLVHRLVAGAFLGPIPDGDMVLHRDDDPVNNKIQNLSFGRHKQNAIDAIRNGRINVGEASPSAKLSDDDVREIVALRRAGWSLEEIAGRFGCSFGTVSVICLGQSRNHATGLPRTEPSPSRLTDIEVREIHDLRRAGRTLKEISERFGCSESAVSQIARGLIRNDVTGLPKRPRKKQVLKFAPAVANEPEVTPQLAVAS